MIGDVTLMFTFDCSGKISCSRSITKSGSLQHKSSGQTAFTMATQNGYPEVMTLLLNSGSDPNVQNIDGDSALHLAVFGICLSQTEIPPLIKKAFPGNTEDMDINIKNNEGVTCLMIACLYQQFIVVETLLKKGCHPNIKNNTGQTALDIAKKTRNTNILLILKHYNASSGTGGDIQDLKMNKLLLSQDLNITSTLLVRDEGKLNKNTHDKLALSSEQSDKLILY